MMRGSWARVTSGTTGLVLLASLAAACSGTPEVEADPTPTPTPTETAPVTETAALTLGVWGAPEEITAFEGIVEAYNAEHEHVEVELVTWEDQATAAEAVAAGQVPDVFMAGRTQLSTLLAEEISQPVDQLLVDREVEFGDGYQRNGLLAFSVDGNLQCMPHGITPMVIYYNTDLVDLERMRERELTTAEPGTRWNFDQFTAAVEFGTKPRRKARGVYIEPTLQALAPLIISAGGDVFDDDSEPTSLAFGSEQTREALERILGLLREPNLTPPPEQVERHGALELFKRGRVAMIAGYRDLVPELREVEGLAFDVMPLPNLGSRTTLGNITGVCLSAATEETEAAADLLAHVISADAVRPVAAAGHLVPANLEASQSEEFLQPELDPATASVFNVAVRDIHFAPLRDDWAALTEAIEPLLLRMLNDPIIDLEELGAQIDEASQAVLAPEPEESESPEDGTEEGTPVPDVDEDDGLIAP